MLCPALVEQHSSNILFICLSVSISEDKYIGLVDY